MARGAANKHLQARIDYLEKASQLVAAQQFGGQQIQEDGKTVNASKYGLPQLFTSHLRSVSLKSQIRLAQEVKRSICRKCDTPLIDFSTAETTIENHSKGQTKPWADIRVVACKVCGTKKRFPIGAKRQSKKKGRIPSPPAKPAQEDSERSKDEKT